MHMAVPELHRERRDALRVARGGLPDHGPATTRQTFRCGTAKPTPSPTTVGRGPPGRHQQRFDGWGYMHLYSNEATTRAVDHTRSPRPRGAVLHGLWRPHRPRVRHRPDPEPRLQLLLRGRHAGALVRRAGASEVGKFIDQGGNNFWGVEQLTTADGQRLIAGSDRDFGLYLFKYTGPGAPEARPAAPT